MRRVIASLVLLAMMFLVAISFGDHAWQTKPYSASKVRVINAGNPQRYDTLLAVPSGRRCVLVNFAAYVHDSNLAAGFHVFFASKNSQTQYIAFHDTLTIGQRKIIQYAGPWVFPQDSTIVVSYYMTVGVLDTLFALPTYLVENAP